MAFYPPGAPAGGAAIDQVARDAATAAQATATAAVSTGAELASLLQGDPAAAAAVAGSSTKWLGNLTGAVSRPLSAKLAEIPSVLDFGAVGDGTTDDTTAFKRAVDFACKAPSANFGQGVVRVPATAGGYRVTEAIFSYKPAGSTALYQLMWLGDSMDGSRILLDPPAAADLWFYDNGASSIWAHLCFQNMSFLSMGTNKAFVNGFKITSSGHEKNFKWYNCRFGDYNDARPMKTGFSFAGTGNADQCQWFGCRGSYFTGPVIILNNTQSVAHGFFGCEFFRLYNDFIQVGTLGGGEITVTGGIIEFRQATTEIGYLVSVPVASASQSHRFYFNGTRFELTDAGYCVKKVGNVGTTVVVFRVCQLDGNPGTVQRDGVEIDAGCVVKFEDCQLPATWNYKFTNTLSATGWAMRNVGSVLMRGCRVAGDIWTRLNFVNGFGGFQLDDCETKTDPETAEAFPAYQDHGIAIDGQRGRMATRAGRGQKVYRVVLKESALAWPKDATGAAGTSTERQSVRRVPFPCWARFRFSKPASGGTGTYQILVGSFDKAVTYCTSVSAAMSAAHSVSGAGNDGWSAPVLLDTANKAKVTMWSTGGSNTSVVNVAGEFAEIEYWFTG